MERKWDISVRMLNRCDNDILNMWYPRAYTTAVTLLREGQVEFWMYTFEKDGPAKLTMHEAVSYLLGFNCKVVQPDLDKADVVDVYYGGVWICKLEVTWKERMCEWSSANSLKE